MLLLTADRFPVITMKYRSPGNASVPVTKRQKRRADKAREGRAPQARTVKYVEEADRAQHRQDG